MGTPDDTVAASTSAGLAEAKRRIEAAREGQAKTLNLLGLALGARLRELCDALCGLADLQELHLGENQLTELPDFLSQLANLRYLAVPRNQLTQLPDWLGQLTNLQQLYVSYNQLRQLPDCLGQLINLRQLRLQRNQLEQLPDCLGRLTNLQELRLRRNRLTQLPDCLGRLINLQELDISKNQLTQLPDCLGRLTNLQQLRLRQNRLTQLPDCLGQLTDLQRLVVSLNRLTELPDSLGRLTNLEELDVSRNQLTRLPDSLGQLANLQWLEVSGNQLTQLPDCLGQLTNLHRLVVSRNPLQRIAPSLARPRRLERIVVSPHPEAKCPPPEISKLGGQAVLDYLRDVDAGGRAVWTSKLLLVGEGKVGKTSLLKALLGVSHDPKEPATHAMEIRNLELPAPLAPGGTLTLTAWDFGGQKQYRAAHPFFLTEKALYLLVWHDRLGPEVCQVEDWLELIQARAPQSKVLLVATHRKSTAPDVDYQGLRRKYPELLAGAFAVENEEPRQGIQELNGRIAELAAGLPLMGVEWPATWLEAADRLAREQRPYLTPAELRRIWEAAQVREHAQPLVERYLHALGRILYYRDHRTLSRYAVRDPQWLAQQIGDVLRSDRLEEGVCRQEVWNQIWADLEPPVRDYLVEIMNEFDLGYRTEHRAMVLVDRLPHQPPAYQLEGARGVTVEYDFATRLLPGIPGYFVARTHRYARVQWRNGTFLRDSDADSDACAVLRSYSPERRVVLSARGTAPAGFFHHLRKVFEDTVLPKYPGIEGRFERWVPCTCGGRQGRGCSHRYRLADIERRTKPTIECIESEKDVPVVELLYGFELGGDRLEQVVREIRETRAAVRQESAATREMIRQVQEQFLKDLDRVQNQPDFQVPMVFTLCPAGWRGVMPALAEEWWEVLRGKGEQFELQLYCQHPGEMHPCGQAYLFRRDPEWLVALRPWLKKLLPLLKTLSPAAGLTGRLELEAAAQTARAVTERLAEEGLEEGALGRLSIERLPERGENTALSAIHDLLKGQRDWPNPRGLRRSRTLANEIVWICPEHAKRTDHYRSLL